MARLRRAARKRVLARERRRRITQTEAARLLRLVVLSIVIIVCNQTSQYVIKLDLETML